MGEDTGLSITGHGIKGFEFESTLRSSRIIETAVYFLVLLIILHAIHNV